MMVAIATGTGLGLSSGSLVLGGGTSGRSAEQSYLNLVTGNLVLQQQDELLLGRGPDLSLVRTYNSQGQFNDDNGDNWRIGFYRQLKTLTGTVNTAGSTITRVGADGAELVYTYDSSRSAYVNKDGAGSYDTLTWNGSQWTWTDGDSRVTETYDWASGTGKLLTLADTDGNTITYGYSGSLLTSVTTANHSTGNKNVTYLDYTGSLLTQIRTEAWDGSSNQTLTRTRYGYDGSNRLSTVTVDLSPNDNSVADGKTYVTTYSYDSSNRVVGITQTDGTQISFTYTSGRITQITQTLAGETRTTGISYDTTNRKTTITDPLGKNTVYTYDTAGQLTNILAPAVGGVSQSLSYAYNANGDLTSQTDAKGQTVAYTYDANGNVTLQRDAAGNTVTRTYGSKNELLSETVYLTPDPDGAGSASASQPLTTRYVYDSKNHLRFAISAEGRVTEQRYDSQGQRTASIVYAGNTYTASPFAESDLTSWVSGTADKTRSLRSDYTYDFRGQLASSTVYASVDSSGNGVATGASTTNYVYDQAGNLLKTVAPKGVATTGIANDFVTTYAYDGLGRLTSTTDTLGRVTQTQYDDANNKTVATLANGLVTTSTYNKAGELISVTQADGATALGTSQYAYDADGRVRMVTDPTGVKSYVLYDDAGRKVADIEGDGSLIEYLYNANNQVIRTIRYATAVSAANLASLVDGAGKPANVALSAIRPSTAAADRSAWTLYDSANRPVKSVDELGYVTQSFYDGAGRVTDTVRYATAVSVSGISASTLATDAAVTPALDAAADRRMRLFYDADGKQTGTLDAGSFVTRNEYDAAGRLVHTVAYATATANANAWTTATLGDLLPTADAAKDIHSWVLYDSKNNVIATVNAEGYLTESSYDAHGNKTSQTRYVNKALIAPTSITGSTTLASLRPATNAQDQTSSWTYTDLNQVATATDYQGTVTQFNYDTVGQLTSSTRALGASEATTSSTAYDKQGRVTSTTSGEGVAVTYAYDAAGRRISATDALGHKTLYYYNSDGNLSFTVNARGEITENRYNALNQLTQTRSYATRTALTGLTGGLDTAVATTLQALASATLDTLQNFSYDLRGQLVSVTDNAGSSSAQTWNAFGEKASLTTALDGSTSVQTQYSYNRRGLLNKTRLDALGSYIDLTTTYDAFGRALTSTDGKGQITSVSYDRLGRVIQTTDPLTLTRSSTYDAFSRVLTQTDALGNTTAYAYDKAARTVTVTTPEGLSIVTTSDRLGQTVSVRDGKGNVTTRTYDKDGRLKTTVNALGNTVLNNTYDVAGLLTDSTDANGTVTHYTYDAVNRVLSRAVDPSGLNLVTSFTYDAKGQTLTTTDANGTVTETTYDAKGQVTQVAVDPAGLNLRTTYTYDLSGKQLTVTEGAGTAAARTTQYTYDKLGRRTHEVLDQGGLSLTTQYAYDNNGNVTSKTDANLNVTRYYYDADNRLIYTLDAKGGLTKTDYDANGRAIQVTRYAKEVTDLTTYTLDNVLEHRTLTPTSDQISRTVYDKDGRAVFSVDALNYVTKNVYDANGNVTQSIRYTTAIPAATAMTTTAVANAITTSSTDRTTSYAYDAANRLTSSTDALGHVTQSTYDAAGHVVRTVDAGNNVTRYVYDKAGRLQYSIDALGGVTEHQYTALGQEKATIRYDKFVVIAAPLPTAANVSSALAATAGIQSITTKNFFDKAGRSTYSVDALGALSEKTYDARGNVVRTVAYATKVSSAWTPDTTLATDAADQITYALYDKADQLAWKVDAAGAVTAYAYDAQGHLIRQTAYDSLITISGRPEQLTSVTVTPNAAKDRTTRTVFDSLGRQVYSIDAANYVKETQYDALGNVTKTIEYPQAINVGLAPTIAEVQAALGGESVNLGVTNNNNAASSTPPVQPYTYSESAKLDTPTATTQTGTVSDTEVRTAAPVQPYTSSGSAKLDTPTTTTQSVTVTDTATTMPGTDPVQPYSYLASAKNDVATTQTQNVGLSVTNTSITQSGILQTSGNGYAVSGQLAGQGGSPNYVRATIYKNGTHYATVYTDAGTWNANGVVQLGSLVTGSYTATLEAQDYTDGGVDSDQYGSWSWGDGDGTWYTSNSISFNVGTQPQSTTVSWASSSQPGSTTASFAYRVSGSSGSWTSATISTSGSNLQVALGTIPAGNYEYKINYTDSYGRIVKSATNTLTVSTNATNSPTASFSYTQVTSTASAGSSITGYVAAGDVASLEYVDAEVRDSNTNALISTARTYPEFESNTSAVNLKVGAVLANGSYNVTLTYKRKNGTTEVKPSFLYQVGTQADYIRNTVSWPASQQPSGTTGVSFGYRLAGSTGAYTSLTVSTSGSNQQVQVDRLAAGSYEFVLTYTDSYGRTLRSANGNFTAAASAGSSTTSVTFSTPTVTSSTVTGSSISGYPITAGEVPTIDKIKAVVKDTNGNVVSTAWTYPEYETSYNGNINLKTDGVLADGRYTVEITVYGKNSSTTVKPTFVYEVGQQSTRAPTQPYAYVASANNDVASTQTQSIGLSVVNTSVSQSGSVTNTVWVPTANGLVGSASGWSIPASVVTAELSPTDSTPTYVRAVIYRTGESTPYATVEHPLSFTGELTGQGEYGSTYTYQGTVPIAWNGSINLGSLPTGSYQVELLVRDDVNGWISNEWVDHYGGGGYENVVHGDGDSAWSKVKTISIQIGSITNPTYTSWASSSQPAGTTASFSFRPSGSTGAWSTASISTNGSNLQANLGSITAGNYEYKINYTDSYGRIVKSATGTLTSNFGGTTTPTASFSYTQVTSTASAGSSITGYVAAGDVASIEYIDAEVRDRFTNALISTARTYPEFESNTSAVNLKVGAVLANGSYNVTLTYKRKNGATETKPSFVYEVGQQNISQNTVTWPTNLQPSGSTVSFQYRPTGTTTWLTASISASGSNHQVSLNDLPFATYEYQILYRDSYSRIVRSADGTLNITSAAGTHNTGVTFSTPTVTSSTVTGSSISGYPIAAGDIPTIDKILATVKDTNGNVVSTAWTYPEYETSYNGNINLKTNGVLANGRYTVEITVYKKDGTNSVKPSLLYEVGPQYVHAANQPYTYLNYALRDSTIDPTQQFTLTFNDPSTLQTANVTNVGWVASAEGLVADGNGWSIPASVVNAELELPDNTPTYIRARIYRDGETTPFATVEHPWTFTGELTGQNQYGNNYTYWGTTSVGWNGSVNLGSLSAGSYRVEILIRDDIASYEQLEWVQEYGGSWSQQMVMHGDGDSAWSKTKTLSVNVRDVNKPSTLSWDASTKPADATTVRFSYRTANTPTAAFAEMPVSLSNGRYSTSLGTVVSDVYEYRIEYLDSQGKVLKRSQDVITDTKNHAVTATSTNANSVDLTRYFGALSSTQPTAVGQGSAITGYFANSTVWTQYDRIEARVYDHATGNLLNTAITLPSGNSGYHGEINLKTNGALVTGIYDVVLWLHKPDGTLEARPSFRYEIGEVANATVGTSLSWSAANQPANSTVQFSYTNTKTGETRSAAVTTSGGNNQVSLGDLTGGTYTYTISYLVGGQFVKGTQGSFDPHASSSSGPATFITDLSAGQQARINTFSYDKLGRLESTIDAENHGESFTYDALGNKLSYTNKLGNTWNYSYDALGQLSSELTPEVKVTSYNEALTLTSSNTSVRLETRYSYDALGHLAARTEAYGTADARTTSYSYDALGHQVQTTSQSVGVYNSVADNIATNGVGSAVTRVESQQSATVSTLYNALGQAVINTDAAGNKSFRVYDSRGLVKYEIDALGYVTSYSFDSFGNQATLTRHAQAINIAGRTTAFSASDVATLLAALDPSGDRTISTIYDKRNLVSLVTEPTVTNYDSSKSSSLEQLFDAGKQTASTYNAQGQLIKQSVLRNSTTNTWTHTYFYYDVRGNKTAQVDALGYLTVWKYDEAGNLSGQIEYAKALASGDWDAISYRNVVTSTAQNSTGELGYDREVRYRYDRTNRKISETRVGYEYTTLDAQLRQQRVVGDLTSSYAYDAVGNMVQTTDPTGATAYSYYDVLGRNIATITPAGNNSLALVETSYDALGNQTRTTRFSNAPTNVNVNGYTAATVNAAADQTSYKVYDKAGHVIRDVDAEGKSTWFSYNSTGQTAKEWWDQTDVQGRVQHGTKLYQYDALGHQIATITPSALTDDRAVQRDGDIRMEQPYFDRNIGGEKITLYWNDISDWGDGDITITVNYQYKHWEPLGNTGTWYNPIPIYGWAYHDKTDVRTFKAEEAPTGTYYQPNGDHVTGIHQIWVQKRDKAGNTITIFYGEGPVASGSGMGGFAGWLQGNTTLATGGIYRAENGGSAGSASPTRLISYAGAPQDGGTERFYYRKVGASTWSVTDPIVFGMRNTVDAANLTGGDGEYEFAATTMLDSKFDSVFSGRFTMSGGNVTSVAKDNNAAAYQNFLNSNVPLAPRDLTKQVTEQVQYNGFGEIVAKGTYTGDVSNAANGWQEYSDYDKAGRVWRTNSGDGVNKVYLYDVAGQKTAEIRSQTLDLKTGFSNVTSVANLRYKVEGNLAAEVSRTETVYDYNERAIQQKQAGFSVESGSSLENWGEFAGIDLATTFNGVNDGVSSHYGSWTETWINSYGGVSSATHWGTIIDGNKINLSFSSTAAWGGGDQRLVVEFGNPATGAITETVDTGFFNGNVSTQAVFAQSNWSANLVGMRLYKKDINGVEHLVQQHNVSSNQHSKALVLPRSTEPGLTAKAEYRAAGSTGAWTTLAVADYGTDKVADLATLPNNANYEYRITYSHHDNGAEFARATGTISINAQGYANIVNTTQDAARTWVSPTLTQTLDRWGNVLVASDPSVTTALNFDASRAGSLSDIVNSDSLTITRYDAGNHVLRQQQPKITTTSATNTTQSLKTVTTNAYDILGRQIIATDANGYDTYYLFDKSGQQTDEYRSDGSHWSQTFDLLGRKTSVTDGNGVTTSYAYDKLNRLTKTTRPTGGGYTSNRYDERGNLIESFTQTQAGTLNGKDIGDTTQAWFDLNGKLIRSRTGMGEDTRNAYDERGNKVYTLNGNGDRQRWAYTYFGQMTVRTDLTANTYVNGSVPASSLNGLAATYSNITTYNLSYNKAGQLVSQTSSKGQDLQYSYYENGAQRRIRDGKLDSETFYLIDANGRHTQERFGQGNVVYQDTRISYNAQGWITALSDNRYDLTYAYDAYGNRRNVIAHYYGKANNALDNVAGTAVLASSGGFGSQPATTTTTQLAETQETWRTTENWYLYDGLNRITLTQGRLVNGAVGITNQQGIQIAYDGAGNRRFSFSYINEGTKEAPVYKEMTERYDYDNNNRITKIYRNGVEDSSRIYDLAGRTLEQTTNAAKTPQKQVNTFDHNGTLIRQLSYSNGSYQSTVYFTNDHAGNASKYRTVGGGNTNYFSYTYAKYDSYKEATHSGWSRNFIPGTTTSAYDVNGNLVSVDDQHDNSKDRSFISQQSGQIVTKTQAGKSDYYYYANDKSVGSTAAGGTVDFDANYVEVTKQIAASAPGTYVVNAGDSWKSIAQNLFGDSRMWYLLADANGGTLQAGRSLTIPNRVTNIHNTSDTYKPYKAGDIIGDTTPTMPEPPEPPAGKKGCGAAMMIIIVIIAIIVTIFTAGAGAVLFGAATTAGAAGATIGGVAVAAGFHHDGLCLGSSWRKLHGNWGVSACGQLWGRRVCGRSGGRGYWLHCQPRRRYRNGSPEEHQLETGWYFCDWLWRWCRSWCRRRRNHSSICKSPPLHHSRP
ncbi:MAG: hypothetical protein QM776_13595 [Rhodocyclaceae bacterium]